MKRQSVLLKIGMVLTLCAAINGGCSKQNTEESTSVATTETTIAQSTETALQPTETTDSVEQTTEETTEKQDAYREHLYIDKDGVQAYQIQPLYTDGKIGIVPVGKYFLICESEDMRYADTSDDNPACKGTTLRLLDRDLGEIVDLKNLPDLFVMPDTLNVIDDSIVAVTDQSGELRYCFNLSLECTKTTDLTLGGALENWQAVISNKNTRADETGAYILKNNVLFYCDYVAGELTEIYSEFPTEDELSIDSLLFQDSVLQVSDFSTGEELFLQLPDGTEQTKAKLIRQTAFAFSMQSIGQNYITSIVDQENYDQYWIYGDATNENQVQVVKLPGTDYIRSCMSSDGRHLLGYSQDFHLLDFDFSSGTKMTIDLTQYVEGQLNQDLVIQKIRPLGQTQMLLQMGCSDLSQTYLYMVDFSEATRESVDLQTIERVEKTDEELLTTLGLMDQYQYGIAFLRRKYADSKAYAEQISNHYSVHVVIGEAAKELNDFGFSCDLQTNEATIFSVLATMDEALSIYPDGFFTTLKDGWYPEGVYFYLCSELNLDGTFPASGFTQEHDDRYLVAINTNEVNLDSVIWHEMSHVIDRYIDSKTPFEEEPFFSNVEWNRYNADGYSYEYTYDSYNDVGDEGTLTAYNKGTETEETVYFVDFYAKLYPAEDHARIMEYALSPAYINGDRLANLDAKQAYMCSYIRHYLDDGSWPEVVAWEVSLNTP